jgi:hypothetical protein
MYTYLIVFIWNGKSCRDYITAPNKTEVAIIVRQRYPGATSLLISEQ